MAGNRHVGTFEGVKSESPKRQRCVSCCSGSPSSAWADHRHDPTTQPTCFANTARPMSISGDIDSLDSLEAFKDISRELGLRWRHHTS
ncbi:hypothetical protein CABS01_12559 [Colletotrichum abscissum]|uniref:uncharacterized protein n=1 Tax=Colletotrichum abscissum TaxID=1671311 RepID=UPI0027D769BF|nr:uncharacterized protein CABS01_12559 [Colletotrichum abscissum]KAK1489978.1 hypothetical protein CABS01_12559 [Colletotrichum abscissum]